MRKFPFEYKGAGYFRLTGVPKGEPAPILHGMQIVRFTEMWASRPELSVEDIMKTIKLEEKAYA